MNQNEVVKVISFKDGLRLVYRLLYNDKWDDNLQEYAVKLLYENCNNFSEEWNQSWENEALLGLACNITCKYDERYEVYKRAFDKANPPPPKLLIALARCCICPGHPPISYDNAIELVKTALKDDAYADGIGLLSHIYSLKDDEENEKYWTRILKNSNQEFISPTIEPKFLVEEYLQELKNEQEKTI